MSLCLCLSPGLSVSRLSLSFSVSSLKEMDPKKAFSLLNEADTEDSTTASFVKKMMQEKPLVRLNVPENKLDGKKTEPRKLDKEESGKKRKAENSDEAEDVKPKKGATKAALKAAPKTDNDNE
jgi:hypothetical protein